ncbi:MAG: response regulator transcription factor [Rhodospirillum sp.]|nr:response regulator transcription factor [Rhodospirillum sp.]MCF8490252.1 response regulator transcription factor [Rhodospirillum sp.]MCF8501251.1 response regulator transcription factor [Rhodospirillum sp.]
MTQEQKTRILVVDDEAQIRKFLRISLSAHGYEVIEAVRGEDAIRKCAMERPDLVVLDLGLPDMDGQAVIAAIREWSAVPILVLSVRAGEMDKVEALENGANDYVTKPFGIAELIARTRVLLRARPVGPGAAEATVYEEGGLRVDYPGRRVWVDGEEVKLTRKEFDLLRLLTRDAGKVLTHEHLLGEVWGKAYVKETQYLRVHLGRLRQKLRDNPNAPRFLWTEPGVGYRLLIE